MNERPRGNQSVMQSRVLPPDSVEMFPTPPWATRALLMHVLPHLGINVQAIPSAWDPMCGLGHMTGVMAEFMPVVWASDIFDYGIGAEVSDFFSMPTAEVRLADWILTNPPFAPALEAVLLAKKLTATGVCVLLRTSWIEGAARYNQLFRDNPPTLFAPFVERVPMVEGRWDPDATTATSYAWFCFVRGREPMPPYWIPPHRARELTRPTDRKIYAPWSLVEDNSDAIEKIACELCAAESVDPDQVQKFIQRDALTYRERKKATTAELRHTVQIPNWAGRRRRADDIFAMRLMARAA